MFVLAKREWKLGLANQCLVSGEDVDVLGVRVSRWSVFVFPTADQALYSVRNHTDLFREMSDRRSHSMSYHIWRGYLVSIHVFRCHMYPTQYQGASVHCSVLLFPKAAYLAGSPMPSDPNQSLSTLFSTLLM